MNVRLYCCMCRAESVFIRLQELANGDAFDDVLKARKWHSFVRLGQTPCAYAVCTACTPEVLKRINDGGSV